MTHVPDGLKVRLNMKPDMDTDIEDLMYCPSVPDKCRGCEININHKFYQILVKKLNISPTQAERAVLYVMIMYRGEL